MSRKMGRPVWSWNKFYQSPVSVWVTLSYFTQLELVDILSQIKEQLQHRILFSRQGVCQTLGLGQACTHTHTHTHWPQKRQKHFTVRSRIHDTVASLKTHHTLCQSHSAKIAEEPVFTVVSHFKQQTWEP